MQLKGRVTRFSEFARSGLAVTKVGIISFSCAVRADSGPDPIEDDTLDFEISNPGEGELEAIVEAVAWARNQVALEVALASRKPEGQRETRNDSVSAVHPYEKEMPSAEEGMSEEARYYWYLQTIAGAVALQELDSIPTDKLNEMMAHIAAFKAKHPEKAEHILKRIKKLVAGL